MSVSPLLRYARTLRPRAALSKGGQFLWRMVRGYVYQAYWHFRCTHIAVAAGKPAVLNRYVPEIPADSLRAHNGEFAVVARHYLEHRFDLLGSGWVRVEHGMQCQGFEGQVYPPSSGKSREQLIGLVPPGNQARARAIWSLVDPSYHPIDWQIDFKSGYRWSERCWSTAIVFGNAPGADIKVPWELARLQHLPQLAWAFVLAGAGGDGFAEADSYAKEFRNQTLDFLAANPPGFGANWHSTMDIAIRAANILLAMDLFQRHGGQFDDTFHAAFNAAMWAHGRHIAAHLDWRADFRGNHYLADIVGLLFVAAYLPRTPESDGWLAFAAHQLIAEVKHQFTADGANFEASTNYHRLSAEMVIYATALVLGLPDEKKATLATDNHRQWRHKPSLPSVSINLHMLPGSGGSQEETPFPNWYFKRLERMAEFTMHATKPNNRVVQIGDTDNGRFFKLFPRYAEEPPREDHLDHRALVAAINGLFRRDDFTAFAGSGKFAGETAMIAGLAKGRSIASYLKPSERPVAARRLPLPTTGNGGVSKPIGRSIIVAPPDAAVFDGLEAFAYPGFGLFLWRSPRLFLSLRCGPIGQIGRGGHAHNDQLALELNIDGVDWIADPGSYVYTAAPHRRDEYRSVQAHCVPRIGDGEPARLDLGLFRLEDRARAECLHFDGQKFRGVHHGFGEQVYRTVTMEAGRIVIEDGIGGTPQAEVQPVTVDTLDALRDLFSPRPPFSPGYGEITKNG